MTLPDSYFRAPEVLSQEERFTEIAYLLSRGLGRLVSEQSVQERHVRKSSPSRFEQPTPVTTGALP